METQLLSHQQSPFFFPHRPSQPPLVLPHTDWKLPQQSLVKAQLGSHQQVPDFSPHLPTQLPTPAPAAGALVVAKVGVGVGFAVGFDVTTMVGLGEEFTRIVAIITDSSKMPNPTQEPL